MNTDKLFQNILLQFYIAIFSIEIQVPRGIRIIFSKKQYGSDEILAFPPVVAAIALREIGPNEELLLDTRVGVAEDDWCETKLFLKFEIFEQIDAQFLW